MAKLMKHVGVYGEKPCVVVFRELPDEPNNCLILLSNTLDGKFHDDVMSVVDSAEGQESNNISEVLFRRRLSDGENMLEALHTRNKLTKVSVDMVQITPVHNQKVQLAEVNAELRKIANQSNPPLKTEANPESLVTPSTQTTEGNDSPEDIATNLLAQAQLIEEDAKAMLSDAESKREEAYKLNPDLAPKRGPGRPPKKETAEI